ncbi:hypothetical protein EQG49_01035 [Periweissella cryptocerci]|uniref:Uncharacterized protein n=1 Tax=Periweissella cryptocerci TaxID=2506420 RepID=A0A4P6YRA1_9LACO|nr:hypothetical protein [Periweissella cryptocerci]QBO35136.1 hypothetical protein EQG49_01035 [Periweissella cryptocerci]
MSRTFIDAKEFAMHFMDSVQFNDEDRDLTNAAKKRLVAYLAAYYVIEDFNAVERQNFASATEKKFQEMSYEELIERVKHLNKY